MEVVKDKDMIPGKFYPLPRDSVEAPNLENYACTKSELKEDGSVWQDFRHPRTGHEMTQITYYRKLKPSTPIYYMPKSG